MSIDQLRRRQEIEVVWVPFPLHPEIPPAGMTLEQLFPGRLAYVDAMRDRLRQRFAEDGLPLGELHRVYNTRLAQELGKWADTQPGGEALHVAIFRSYFAEGVNIGEPRTLVRIVEEAGLDPEAASRALRERSFAPAVEADWERARNLGLTSVPTFVAGGRGVSGAQPVPVLEQLVRLAAEEKQRDDPAGFVH